MGLEAWFCYLLVELFWVKFVFFDSEKGMILIVVINGFLERFMGKDYMDGFYLARCIFLCWGGLEFS